MSYNVHATCALFLLLIHPIANHPVAGGLDLSFGSNNTGIVIEAIGRSNTIKSIAIQSDDSIITAGKVFIITSSSGIAHFFANGIFDSTFNADGYTRLEINSMETIIQAAAIQSNGQLIVTGYILDNPIKSFIARYNPAGTLDYSFNETGYAIVDTTGGCIANALSIQNDGKIVIAGTAGEGTPGFFIARYNADGSNDNNFDSNSITQLNESYVSSVTALAIQPDGKILAAGFSRNLNTGADMFALARLNADGSVDTSFGAQGIATTQIGAASQAHAMILQPDGSIVLGGHTTTDFAHYQFALARYNATGTLDNTFNGTGTIITDLDYSSRIYALALQADGKILAGGSNFGAQYTGFVLGRYLSTGTLDDTFGTEGITQTQIGSTAQINSLALQSDGKIIAGGFSDNNAVLARYLAA